MSLENCGGLGARYVWAGGVGRNLAEEQGDDQWDFTHRGVSHMISPYGSPWKDFSREV